MMPIFWHAKVLLFYQKIRRIFTNYDMFIVFAIYLSMLMFCLFQVSLALKQSTHYYISE